MDRKVAKDLLHIREWLDRAHDIVSRGQDVYARDALLQEAGDSLMMKLGERPADWPGPTSSRPLGRTSPRWQRRRDRGGHHRLPVRRKGPFVC